MTFKHYLFSLFLSAIFFASASVQAAEAGYDELVQESLQARNAGDFSRAEALLLQARPLGRETNEIDYLLGMTLAFQERFIESMQTIDEALSRYPDDVLLRLARARVLSYQGIYDSSIAETELVLEADPNNLEARNLQARIYYYQRRYAQSITSFQQVLERDAGNLEALVGLHDAELARNNNGSATAWLAQAAEVAPGHIDVVTRQENRAAPVARPHLLTVGTGMSRFDRAGFSRWYDRFVEYRYLRNNGDQFFVLREHDHRFSLHDSLTQVGYRYERPGQLPLELVLSWNSDGEFLPERRIRIGTDFLLRGASDNFGATTLGIVAAQSRYNTGDVTQLGLNFSHYLLNSDAWITPGVGWVRDENGISDLSWTLGAHWQSTARLLLGYNYTYAPETENNSTALTKTHHLYARYQLNDSFALRVDGASSDRSISYERRNIAVSLQYRF